jgi:hypothetical protein
MKEKLDKIIDKDKRNLVNKNINYLGKIQKLCKKLIILNKLGHKINKR